MKKIGILGSGIVGTTLADGFIKHGYSVKIGTRNPDKLSDWDASSGPQGSIGNFQETADFGDTIVLAVKGTVAEDVVSNLSSSIKGKTVIDATNPIAEAPPTNGVLHFFTDLENSLMERLQDKVPSANFVKAFNSIGNAFMVNPQFESKPTMFICGNNDGAREEVTGILDQFGFEVEDLGGVEAARAIEPLCILWCIPGFLNNQWSHGFKLLKAQN